MSQQRNPMLKIWIWRRLRKEFSTKTIPSDVEMIAVICRETGWPAPARSGKRDFFQRYWDDVKFGRTERFAVPMGDRFYRTPAWRAVRYKALKLYGARCQCCGNGPNHGVVLHVDHIKPKSRHPELALEITNLQVLCEDCNLGKMARDETDWRESPDRNDVGQADATGAGRSPERTSS